MTGTTARCPIHPAYDADYCIPCGTAYTFGTTDAETAANIARQQAPRVLSYDEAEAAGFDGTGRDGDPRFPYTTNDVAGR